MRIKNLQRKNLALENKMNNLKMRIKSAQNKRMVVAKRKKSQKLLVFRWN